MRRHVAPVSPRHQRLPAPGVYDDATTLFVITVSDFTTPLTSTMALTNFVMLARTSTALASMVTVAGDRTVQPAAVNVTDAPEACSTARSPDCRSSRTVEPPGNAHTSPAQPPFATP